ncbi:CoA transferase [Methylobacterium symbioticum]|uniref:Acetyl-CoA:oxalate CoA-transferase n=1 Tax=Methylobacterium symbioticum TaxID=2584084 RepID=A0A509E624_9HYPH|nr:CoA transferase [Methylobacterium symbioticum]VUD69667.1 Acetyl-CoA:oxalate CoA-transferase [Methylobacterium symbioticum]
MAACDCLRIIWAALGAPAAALERAAFTGEGALPALFAVTDLAAGSVAAAGLALAELAALRRAAPASVTVDRRLAAFWFASSVRPIGWTVPAPWDPIAGDYETRDGWIRLHTNAPHHRAAAERVLGTQSDRAGMAAAVARWTKADLEAAVLAEGGCAAEMRSLAAWLAHPQGVAVAAEPLVAAIGEAASGRTRWRPTRERPLNGLRVLDLTRGLAGPVATRFLAGYGAAVLRIDPPGWDEPALVPDITAGKACARLDLRDAEERARFEALLAGADILLHGYRPGALEHLGYGEAARRALAPGLIDVRLDAYGWTGPWAGRRGFDSLVQMSAGIAEAGQAGRGADRPVPLPVQALDHATGYILAATALRGLHRREAEGSALTARLSLARTAKLLTDAGPQGPEPPLAPETEADLDAATEATAWGPARRLRSPLVVGALPMRFARPARTLGSAPARWADAESAD